ncbi:MAG: F0F1 ATP synthase subunit beta, partial [Acidimicrobiales bacterium]
MSSTSTTSATNTPNAPAEKDLRAGRVVAIAGPVVDVEFPPDSLPDINSAVEMEIELEGERTMVMAEVALQIGEGRARCICLKPTDGLRRGTPVRNLGRGITVPVGDAVLGHVFNVVGDVLDSDPLGEMDDRWEIHRPPPDFDALEPKS